MPESDPREPTYRRAPRRSPFTRGRLSLFAGLIIVGVAGAALQACGPLETANAAGTPQPAAPDRTLSLRSPEPPTVTAQIVPTAKPRTTETATLTKADLTATARALETLKAESTTSASTPKPSPSVTR